MARRPFSILSTLKQIPKSSSVSTRTFHQSAPFRPANAFFKSKPASSITALAKPRDAFRRTYIQPSSSIPSPNTGNLKQRLIYGAGLFGGTVLAINLVFNRETREDGGMPPFERSFLNETFLHTGLGVGIIGVVATALHQSGFSYRIMSMNPWLVIGGSLALSIGTMYGCTNTRPDK